MYKKRPHTQLTFDGFNQPLGLTMNPENRWVQKASLLPWEELEEEYASLFKSEKGNVAKPFRMAFGSLLIQKEYDYSDEELVLQIQENPYLQYFIGLPGYQDEKPFDSSSLVHFRKRLTAEKLAHINERLLAFHEEDDDDDEDDGNQSDTLSDGDSESQQKTQGEDETPSNKGTLMIDATCAPSYIKFPQDIVLLNDARLHAEKIVDDLCETYGSPKPRMYRRKARKDYLRIAKKKKKSKKIIRAAIRKQLGYVKRDIRYIEHLQEQDAVLTEEQAIRFYIIQRIFEQQDYMYQNKTHSVPNRIVSFSQPYLRPIVRGKAKTPTEFGAKVDISQAAGFLRIERLSFEAFNESVDLIPAVERYKERTGHYPERVLVDQIYRTRENRAFCKKHTIRLSGPKLGRPKKDQTVDKQVESQDNRDRIQIEREFSLAKRCHGLGLIRTRLATTTLTSITLSIVSLNLSKIQRDFLCAIFREVFLAPIELFYQSEASSFEKLSFVQ